MKRCLSAVHSHNQEQYVQIKHLDAVYIVAKKPYIMKIVKYTAFFLFVYSMPGKVSDIQPTYSS